MSCAKTNAAPSSSSQVAAVTGLATTFPSLRTRAAAAASLVQAVAGRGGDELDWRLHPDRPWSPYTLRGEDRDRCAALVAELGLRYGGIDLAIDASGDPWFLEVNPNGEWGWLAQGDAELPIVEAIADELTLSDVRDTRA